MMGRSPAIGWILPSPWIGHKRCIERKGGVLGGTAVIKWLARKVAFTIEMPIRCYGSD